MDLQSSKKRRAHVIDFEPWTLKCLVDCDGSTVNFIFGLVEWKVQTKSMVDETVTIHIIMQNLNFTPTLEYDCDTWSWL